MSKTLNLYSARLYGEHPIANWPLDEDISGSSPQYSSVYNPATINAGYSIGLPIVYGSRRSVGINATSTGIIIRSQDRLWENVKTYSDTGFQVPWSFWENINFTELMSEDYFTIEFGQAAISHNSYGMFSNAGKYNTYTAEFWMRIDPRTTKPRKIWGTLTTLDGIWVNDSYITLVVGKENKSYAVENWYRPMLVNVTYSPTEARLVINGQEVVSLQYQTKDVDFSALDPNFINDEGKLGFMSYPNVNLYEVDQVSLFPYIVPDDVLKRRFVWGQGISDTVAFSSFFETTTAYIDYPFAKYSSNVSYPDLYNWESGYLSGLVSTRNVIKTPNYRLPEIFIAGRSLEVLYRENLFNNQNSTEPGFSFKPEYDWTQPSYFYLDSIERLTAPPQIIYGVFAKQWYEVDPAPQTLMRFTKKYSDNVADVIIEGNTVSYRYNGTVKKQVTITDNVYFTVGFDLNKIVQVDTELRAFFYNLNDVEVYVGGDGTTTFSGLIYRVGISDTPTVARNETASKFTDGYANASADFINNSASYVLRPFVRYGEFYLDVAASGYWEDSIPLSFLGKNLQDTDGSYFSKLNFFQINFGYDGDYIVDDEKYDFSGSEMKAYITFQPLIQKIDKPLRDFTTTEKLSVNRIVNAQSKTSNELSNTRFEITNGTVVIPPSNYDAWKVTVYFVVNAEGTISSPFEIKNLSLSSQVYKDKSIIGTRFGVDMNSTSRYAIYKESSPYLYLTKDSGIEPLDGPVNVPVNAKGSYPYPVGSINMFLKPNLLLDDANELFVVTSKFGNMQFIYDGTGWVLKKNGLPIDYIKLFQNGTEVTEVTLEPNQWTMIGIEFGEPLEFGGYLYGNIALNKGAVYQNISISALSETQVESTAIIRNWNGVNIQSWQNWIDDPSVDTFADLVSSRAYLQYPVDPTQIFKIFTGGNSVAVGEQDIHLSVGNTDTTLYTGVFWDTYDRRPT